MKQAFPMNPTIIILNQNEDKVTLFSPLTSTQAKRLKEEVDHVSSFPKVSNRRRELNDLFYKHHKFMLDNIIAIGDTKMETRLANSLIEHHKVKILDVIKANYKCFVNHDWKTIGQMNLPYHEDGGCSWNCLMDKLKHPEWGVIFNIPANELTNFKIN